MCRFTAKDFEQLDKNKQWSRALDGSSYLPGMVYFFFLEQNELLLIFYWYFQV